MASKKRGRPLLPATSRLVRINGFYVDKPIADYLKTLKSGERSAWLRSACCARFSEGNAVAQTPR